MKKIITPALALLLIISSFGFKAINSTEIVGTYGVSDTDPSQIELVLNKDHSYTYQDFSNSSKKIEVSGEWELKNKNTILLKSDSELSFHRKWKIVNEGKTAKSRNGLCFYTISKKQG